MLKSIIVVIPMAFGAMLARSANADPIIVSHAVSSAAALVGTPSPLPEPAVWAMLLVGFGSAGALLRRRRAGLIEA
jgi:cyanate permease